MEDKEVVISFTMLNDLRHMEEWPKHKKIKYNKDEIIKFIREIDGGYLSHEEYEKYLEKKTKGNKYHDKSQYFKSYDGKDDLQEEDIEYIANELMETQYFVKNRYNKYYVIAFAINYTRFEIYSKDCDKELIDWGIEELGQIKGEINDPDYNVNSVIKLVKELTT